MQIHLFSEFQVFQTEIVKICLETIEKSVDKKSKCIIALSGGNTPKPLYRRLARELSKRPYLLQSVVFIQVDERFVDAEHPRSNQKMIRQCFEHDQIRFIPIPSKDSVATAEEAKSKYVASLLDLFELDDEFQIDLVILGMGTDGHTASLFPGNEEYLKQLNNREIAISTFVRQQNEFRISLTSFAINQSKKKILLMTGKEKMDTLKKIMNESNIHKYPILSVAQGLTVFSLIEDDEG